MVIRAGYLVPRFVVWLVVTGIAIFPAALLTGYLVPGFLVWLLLAGIAIPLDFLLARYLPPPVIATQVTV
jgi:hypothetical protein